MIYFSKENSTNSSVRYAELVGNGTEVAVPAETRYDYLCHGSGCQSEFRRYFRVFSKSSLAEATTPTSHTIARELIEAMRGCETGVEVDVDATGQNLQFVGQERPF